MRAIRPTLIAALLTGATMIASCAPKATPVASAEAGADVIYFVLPDRFDNGDPRNDQGGLTGARTDTGFDPTHKGYYHGGDLAGLTRRLDYIAGMGATAIWLGPIYKNRPWQPHAGGGSAGYHGYWITDFTTVDPHFGTMEELEAFVAAAHAKGLKVYLDIITNHTADIIQMRECEEGQNCPYRSVADYPWTRAGGDAAKPINNGFLAPGGKLVDGDYSKLVDPNWAYTPYVPDAWKGVKKPDWLNDPIYYHNRGTSTFEGESSQLGDFPSSLDDLFTEHPRVVDGMIEIYGDWIERLKIDGFRIDTARHVNDEFWHKFNAAMLERAKAAGVPHFRIFGEVYNPDPAALARFTTEGGFPAVLDFAFQDVAAKVAAQNAAPALFKSLAASDALYASGSTVDLPTFLGNHDMGRIGRFVRIANPNADDAELLARVRLAHALMLSWRGVPTIYSGDEQGFTGDGNDQDAREDMFPSQVAIYNDNDLIGTDATTATENFDAAHPIYRTIAELSAVRRAQPALWRGDTEVLHADEAPGILLVRRTDAATSETVLLAFNTASETKSARIDGVSADGYETLVASAPSIGDDLSIPAFGWAVLKAK